MTDSRDSRAAMMRAAALFAALSVGISPAMAQAPAALTPSQPISILPQNTPDAAPAISGDAAQEPSEPAIAASELDAPSIDRIGLMSEGAGGFSPDMWRGTDLELLRLLLPQLPRRMDSLAQRRIARSLLLSAAAPPVSSIVQQPGVVAAVVGTPGETPVPGVAQPPSQWLLENRLIGLAALGNWEDVLALMDLVPADVMTEGLKRLRADALLATDRASNACGEAPAALAASPDPYWQKLQVYCQFAGGQASAASLGLSVLRELNVDDPLFFWTVELIRGSRPLSPANLGRAEPLHLMMLVRAGGPVPDALVQGGDPTTLAVLSTIAPPPDDKADKTPEKVKAERRRAAEEARIVIAEKAVAAGTLDPERLRLLYRNFNVKDQPPPRLTEITGLTVRERAHLFQTALAQNVPAARAEVMTRAIDLARAAARSRGPNGERGPDVITAGRVYAPLLMEIEPTPDLVWFAGAAARGLIAAGEIERGEAWLAMARSMARTSIEAGMIADGLWPIHRLLSGETGRMPPQALSAWRESLPDGANRARAMDVMFSVLAGAGETISAADWLPGMGDIPMNDTMHVTAARVWNGLDLAARDKRVGETVVLALLALGEGGPAETPPATLQKVISSLMAVGRAADARAIAVEALLVQGL